GRGDRVGAALPQPAPGPVGPRDPSALGVGGLRSRDRRSGERAPRQDRQGGEVSRGALFLTVDDKFRIPVPRVPQRENPPIPRHWDPPSQPLIADGWLQSRAIRSVV